MVQKLNSYYCISYSFPRNTFIMSSSAINKFILASRAVNEKSEALIRDFEVFHRRVRNLLVSMTRGEVCTLVSKYASDDTYAFIESHYGSVEVFVKMCARN